MYPKTVTERIVELWAHGFSAQETRQALNEQFNIHICLDTVYKHRHSLTAEQLIDELIRQQERDILKADAEDRELAMRYRNELLKILLPQRIETKGEFTQTQRVLHLHMWKPEQIAEQ